MRPRRIARRLPRPLLLLLGAVVLLGLAWSVLLPPWQAPDENNHFAYAQSIAEGPRLPGGEPGRIASSEQRGAAAVSNLNGVVANLSAKPVWSPRVYEEWRDRPESDRDDGGGRDPTGEANPARTNPPLFYALEVVPYQVASGGDVFDRIGVMRFASVLFFLVAVIATWMLIGELFGRQPLLQLAGAAIVGLQPMAVFMAASVNPDGLLNAAMASVLWLGVRILKRGLSPALAVAICAALAVAILTKATAYAFLPAVLLALAVGLHRMDRETELGKGWVAAAGLVLAVPVGGWVLFSRLNGRPAVNQIATTGSYTGPDLPNPFGYLWQFYLPKLPFGASLPEAFPALPVVDYFLEGGWAKFGWLEVSFPDWFYVLPGLVTVAIVAGGVAAFVRRGVTRDLPVTLFLALAALGLLSGLHLTEYRILHDQGIAFIQGRYLFPLLPVAGVATAAALTLLAKRRGTAAGVLIGSLLAMQLASLALVAGRFYA